MNSAIKNTKVTKANGFGVKREHNLAGRAKQSCSECATGLDKENLTRVRASIKVRPGT